VFPLIAAIFLFIPDEPKSIHTYNVFTDICSVKVYFHSDGGYFAPTLQWLKRFL
jgi:hypothetical protein